MSTFTEIEQKIEEAFKPYRLTVGELKKMLANQSDDMFVNFSSGNTILHPYEQWSGDESFNMSFVEE